jgi:hypothetical protein
MLQKALHHQDRIGLGHKVPLRELQMKPLSEPPTPVNMRIDHH